MPLPAGTGMTAARFVARSRRARAHGLRRRPARALRRGDRGRGRRRRPSRRSSSPSSCSGGADALSLLYPAGDPLYPQVPPDARGHRRHGVHRGHAPLLASGARAARELHDEGKVTVLPAIGYDHPDQSHFTSRHFWEVGATDAHLLTGWLGRYLDVVGNAGQPAAGPLDDRLAVSRRSRPPRSRSRRSTGPTSTTSGARRLGHGAGPDARRDGRARQRAVARPGVRDGRERDRAGRHAAPPARCRSRARQRRPRRCRTRTGTTRSRSSCRASPR